MSFGFCKALLSERARLSSIPGASILQIACVCKCQLEMIKKLVEDDRELLLMKDDGGHVAIHTAAKYSSLEIIQYLVDSNESTLTMLDEFGELSLHKACRVGNVKAVEYLMEKNMASVTTKNHHNLLPLHIMCDKAGKSEKLLQSVQYHESIFKLLQANPESL
mmetsp:Transcript_22616/g.48976  ORF Transcript_22616/g.48976 Transcript_22616/m.48976 type:complete len:163 (+) Transcript_22616:149-637(+)